MKYSVGEMARLTGVTIRTLRYYDSIGLLVPSEISDAGYRFYDDDALDRLRDILFLRELGLSLADIKNILAHPDYDRTDILRRQRELLVLQRERIDAMLDTIDIAIGGIEMKKNDQRTTAAEVEELRRKHADEVRARWGSTPQYAQSEQRAASRTEEQTAACAADADDIFAQFAALRHGSPDSAEAAALVRRWQAHITEHYYTCTDSILLSLGEMYVADERFTQNLDRFGEGTAAFMRDAIRAYCKH